MKHGGAIDPDGLKEIEELIPDYINGVKRLQAQQAEADGKLVRFDPAPEYI